MDMMLAYFLALNFETMVFQHLGLYERISSLHKIRSLAILFSLVDLGSNHSLLVKLGFL
jgi:hypothetical protein